MDTNPLNQTLWRTWENCFMSPTPRRGFQPSWMQIHLTRQCDAPERTVSWVPLPGEGSSHAGYKSTWLDIVTNLGELFHESHLGELFHESHSQKRVPAMLPYVHIHLTRRQDAEPCDLYYHSRTYSTLGAAQLFQIRKHKLGSGSGSSFQLKTSVVDPELSIPDPDPSKE